MAHNFPTMKTINYDYTFEIKKQYMGRNRDAVKKLRVINIKPKLIQTITEDKIRSYISNVVIFYNYPFKQEAWLKGIYYNNQYYYLDAYNKINIDMRYKLPLEIKDTIKRDWTKKGVNIDTNILCDIAPLRLIARNCDGTLQKVYEERRTYFVPFEITSLNSTVLDFIHILKDYDNFQKKFNHIETEFNKEDSTIIFSKVNFGNISKPQRIVDKKDPNYEKFNNENYDKHYDSKANYDLQGKDWEVSVDAIYNGPLIEVTMKNSQQTSFVADPYFAKNVYIIIYV